MKTTSWAEFEVRLAALPLLFLSLCGHAQIAPPIPSAKHKEALRDPYSEKQSSTHPSLGLDLLLRSHALNEQLDEKKRSELLTGQIFAANRFDTKLGTAWAHELFDIGAQGQVRNPGLIEILAVNSIAASDPDDALKLLAQVDSSAVGFRPENDLQGATYAVRTPQTLFRGLRAQVRQEKFPQDPRDSRVAGRQGTIPVRRRHVSVH